MGGLILLFMSLVLFNLGPGGNVLGLSKRGARICFVIIQSVLRSRADVKIRS